MNHPCLTETAGGKDLGTCSACGTGTRCRERVLKESNRQGSSLSFQRVIWVFDFDIVKNLDTFPSLLNWLFTDREAWCAAIHGVAKSRTQLSH